MAAALAIVVCAIGLAVGVYVAWLPPSPAGNNAEQSVQETNQPAVKESDPDTTRTAPAEGYAKLPQERLNQGIAYLNQGAYDRAIANFYVGAYIARHSQIMLALWDGVASDAEGGTAEVVHFKLVGVPERYAFANERSSPLDPVDSGPVYHIVTPRTSNPRPQGQAYRLSKRFPQRLDHSATEEASYDRIYSRMSGFNSDANQWASTLAEERARSKASIIPTTAANRLSPSLRHLLEYYALADRLAMHFQAKTLLSLRGLLTLSLLGALFFQVYSYVETKPWGLASLYLGALGAAYTWYLWAKWCDYENKYLDYQALAEGLRVQFFWDLAGLQQSVADHYLRKQQGELDWIRQALRVWSLVGKAAGSATEAQAELKGEDGLSIVLKNWVEDQYTYFSWVALRDQTAFQKINKLGFAFFLIGMALGVVKVFLSPGHPMLVAAGIAVVIAALLVGYGKSRALSEHAKQYGRMSLIFANAKRRLVELVKAEQPAAALALIEELGKEALIENGDWVLLHRDRPLQVPKA